MKYIITESSRHKLVNLYLDSLKMKVESDNLEIFVHDATNDEYGMFNFDYSEEELAIDPFIISMVSGMFNMDRGQAMEGIAMWFENKFEVTVYDVREWDW